MWWITNFTEMTMLVEDCQYFVSLNHSTRIFHQWKSACHVNLHFDKYDGPTYVSKKLSIDIHT